MFFYDAMRLNTQGHYAMLSRIMSEARLTDVESSLAFLEKTVHELSDVVRHQHDEIDRLNGTLQRISERLDQMVSPDTTDAEPYIEKPPHY